MIKTAGIVLSSMGRPFKLVSVCHNHSIKRDFVETMDFLGSEVKFEKKKIVSTVSLLE
jgi:hypothetical protein